MTILEKCQLLRAVVNIRLITSRLFLAFHKCSFWLTNKLDLEVAMVHWNNAELLKKPEKRKDAFSPFLMQQSLLLFLICKTILSTNKGIQKVLISCYFKWWFSMLRDDSWVVNKYHRGGHPQILKTTWVSLCLTKGVHILRNWQAGILLGVFWHTNHWPYDRWFS